MKGSCLLLTLALLMNGCAAVPLATVGTAAGIAATAFSTGSDVYRLGKLNTAEMIPIEAIHTAVHAAGRELSLTQTHEQSDMTTIRFRLEDDAGSPVRVLLERRTATLTRIRIDVGLFGNEPTARLFLERVRTQLRAAGHFNTPEPQQPAGV